SAGESSSTTGSGGCEPIPQRGTGVPSGFERCEGGVIVRAEPVACPAVDLSTFDVPASCGDNDASCASHEECSDGRGLGICEQSFYPEPNCLCRYPCETDADCDDGSICLCGIEVPDVGSLSVCVPAECSTNDDCEAGLGCGLAVPRDGCGGPFLACRTPVHTCSSDVAGGVPGDIGGGCRPDTEDGMWRCFGAECAIGRPFTVAGEIVSAGATGRGDWVEDPGVARRAPESPTGASW